MKMDRRTPDFSEVPFTHGRNTLMIMDSRSNKKRYLLSACISLVTLVVFALTYVAFTHSILEKERKAIYNEKIKVGSIAVNHFVDNALPLLLNEDTLGLNVLLKQAGAIPSVSYALIADTKGLIKAHSQPSKIGSFAETIEPLSTSIEGITTYETYKSPQGPLILRISKPLVFLKESRGFVRVGLLVDQIDADVAKEVAGTSMALSVLGILSMVIFTFGLVGLVLWMGRGSGRMAENDLFGEAEADEQHQREPSGNEADHGSMPSFEETRRNQVSVLFVGIKGFKAYAEDRDPDSLMEDLNEYLRIASGSVQEFGGFIDKLVGDGVISIFTSSVGSGDHAERAVQAALLMQERFKNQGTAENGLLRKASVGISSGVVLSGSIGSETSREIAFLGETFRTAYSLTVLAGPGEIVLSREAYRLLENKISVEPLPPRDVLKRTKSWESFRLIEGQRLSNR
jgi:adenylate cyclase